MTSPARLDPARVRSFVEGFPIGPDWQSLRCAELGQSKRAVATGHFDWKPLKRCEGKCGIYAFLFPGDLFKMPRSIALHAPRKKKVKQTIQFEFYSHPDLLLPDHQMVAYVGRSANLLDRIQGHFRLSKQSTLAQVQYGLVNSGVCSDRANAVQFMLSNAVLTYALIDGSANVANRDVIEVALWAKYMTPFNIKSER